MASLEKVLTYDFDTMICHHAGVIENGRELVQMKLDYLQEIQQRVHKLAREGNDVFEVTQQLFPKHYPIVEQSHTEWSAMHMVRVFMNQR